MPNYENLLSAKKFHLRKLIKACESDPKDPTTLVLHFDPQKLYQLQLQQKLKITPESIRNCLFFLVQSPLKITLNFKKSLCRLEYSDPLDCLDTHRILSKEILKKPKTRCERLTKSLTQKIWGVFCGCFRDKGKLEERLKRKEMTSNLMANSTFLFAAKGEEKDKQ